MHIRYLLPVVASVVMVCGLPSPPRDEKPTLFNPDGTPASTDGWTPKMNGGPIRWKGPAEKYFHESAFDGHYDGRFTSRLLPPEARNSHLRALLRTYLATMDSINAETWIMHGSLLGWWWNRRIMPWDSDIDVQVSEPGLAYLAANYNMSVHSFQDVDWLGEVDMGGQDIMRVKRNAGSNDSATDEGKRRYLLDINPNWKNGTYADIENMIDGRWIDMQTGLYIDITSVRWNRSSPVPGTLYCKDRHHYLSRQIFPLRTSQFEGVPAKIPYAYQELLAEEYGPDSLVERMFSREGHWFDDQKMEWVPVNRYDEKFRQYATHAAARKKAATAKTGRKKPSAKTSVRGENTSGGNLKPKDGRKEVGVFSVILELFVGG